MAGPDDPVYLDYNATTPVLGEVVDAMLPYLREHFGNPSSGHVYGARAMAAVDEARDRVAALLGARPSEVVFTSGGTEANNLAIRGVTARLPEPGHVVTSLIEHPATSRPCAQLERQGFAVTRVGVDDGGRVRPEDLGRVVTGGTALVTLMHSNNETGVLQPIQEAARLAHDQGALMHTDAAQSVGKVPIDVAALGVDLLSLAGHKLYAPKGVGALYVKAGTELAPLVLGAGHEGGRRPGTENVASIVGLGVACEIARRDLEASSTRLRRLRDQLWDLLRVEVAGLAINGAPGARLPNTLNVRFPEVSGTALLAGAPEVAASTGSACHDGRETASAVILAMGVPPASAAGSVRLTLGRGTTDEHVETAARALVRSWRTLVRPRTIP
ncbi:MAG: cysteine desulfurase NifS [Deltaproteobacteria bacterium]|nr:MAG: cysteine desulfurase NifS [Deltaproteobacteria bacterium]